MPNRRVLSLNQVGRTSPGFGATLRSLREIHRLSQGELAKRLNRSTSFISMLESGQRRPTIELVNNVGAALNLSEEERQKLLEAGGFSGRDLESAIERVVEIIAEEVPQDDVSLALLRSDLMANAAGWREALYGARHLRGGEFAAATQYFTNLADQTNYTPTLTIYLKNRLVDVQLRSGKLDAAKATIQLARQALDRLPGSWAQTLRAETIATQAMVALRTGLYSSARALMDQSKEQYVRYFRHPASDDSVAAQGYGRSYKRLAQVELFQGEPDIALDHCITAETYLMRAPASTTRDLWLRRTRELQGWAWTKLHDFTRAITLHTRLQQECVEAGDDYGRIMNQLYLADDYRGLLEDLIEPDIEHRNTNFLEAADWRKHVSQVLAPAKEQLDEAVQLYRKSLTELIDKGDELMRGRCLRCLAVVLRFQGAFWTESTPTSPGDHANNPLDEEAEHRLFEALEIERAIGQWRRIPGIYEALADLAWDRGLISDARDYYQAALHELDSWRLSAADPAAINLRRRIQGHLNVLGDQPNPRLPSPEVSAPWRRLSEQLIDVVCSTIIRLNSPCSARSDKDEEWVRHQLAVEELPGSRLLAQDRLSLSLSPLLTAGYPASAAGLHLQRHEAFLRNLEDATSSSHDLCYRISVEDGLRVGDTRALYHEQMRRAYDLLHYSKGTYRLDAGLESLPFGFMVKGSHVLLELPPEVGVRLPAEYRQGTDTHGPFCFHIDDVELAAEVTEIFQALVDLARDSTRLRGLVPEWLRERLQLDRASVDMALATSM